MSVRRSRLRTTLLVALALAVVTVSAVVAFVLWPRGSELERAAALLPKETIRVAWTDWAGVREELDANDVDDTGPEAEEFLAEASDRDLSSASPTAGSSFLIADAFGFGPLTLRMGAARPGGDRDAADPEAGRRHGLRQDRGRLRRRRFRPARQGRAVRRGLDGWSRRDHERARAGRPGPAERRLRRGRAPAGHLGRGRLPRRCHAGRARREGRVRPRQARRPGRGPAGRGRLRHGLRLRGPQHG